MSNPNPKPRTKLRHGFAHHNGQTRTYRIWAGMRKRCNDPNCKEYKNYGGRGISVCLRWDSFLDFLSDMGNAPDKLTLERINNDKGYYKANCRWATRKEQMANRRKPASTRARDGN